MSHVKDSSLARSRIKRSHRIPARLADFREFPQETSTPKAGASANIKSITTTGQSSNSKTGNSAANSAATANTSNGLTTPTTHRSSSKSASTTHTSPEPEPAHQQLRHTPPPIVERPPPPQPLPPVQQQAPPPLVPLKQQPPPQQQLQQPNPQLPPPSQPPPPQKPKHQPKQQIRQQQQQSTQQQHLSQPTTKYITSQLSNNVATNMQYGTRLLINEPVYLPRNVATISPITTNLQQMEDYVRRLPLMSKTAQLCIAYQDQRLLNSMTSNYTALLKIASYLEVRDWLQLRRVNKTWKSIIDSDIVWKSVRINESIITDWMQFGNILYKRGTIDLHIRDYVSSVSWFRIYDLFKSSLVSNLQNLYLYSQDHLLNRHFAELCCLLNSSYTSGGCEQNLRVLWRVKGFVDEYGNIQIEFKTRKKCTQLQEYEDELYIYQTCKGLITDQSMALTLDITFFESLFNGGPNDFSKLEPSEKPVIEIKAV